jgi:hypothetical protein
MKTLVVLRPTTTTLLRRPTLHMIMMIEGPPLFGAWCERGSVLTIYPCGGGVYLHVYLSIYPRIVDMYELMCVVWWLVKNLELFKFVRPNCASVEPCLSTCDAWCLLFLTLLIFISCHMYHGLYITLMHLCMQFESEKTSKCVIGIWGLRKSPSTHLGGVSFSNYWIHTSFIKKNCGGHQSPKRGRLKEHLGP